MSVILRYVLCNEEAAVVKETFFGYLTISDSTGKGLLDAFLEKATELQLELSDCRGQSYDNGANMKGKHSGVQARMLDINPKAVYVPCANHTLNLVVVDSANSSTEALTFFMTCTFGIGMLYSDISLFTYVQIVVYFLNAAFQFYTSKVI